MMTHMRKMSNEWLARAKNVIPGCSQTFSKSYTQYVQGIAPVAVVKGEGPYLIDVDNNRYIDYPMGLGAIILGYNYPDVNNAIMEQLKKGVSFSLPHFIEVELAEKLVEIIPCAEMVRFGKNGSDATSGAVRLARAVTGKDRIACCGYHGWQDWYIGSTSMNAGVPEAVQSLTHTFKYNDIATLETLLNTYHHEFAAVIMEPAGQIPDKGFLQGVKELTRRHGAILIFDEVVSGFRLHIGGAQALYGATPDLACFGKAMANGLPISAIVGRSDLMKEFERVFFSFTQGGEAISIAAALATIKVLEEADGINYIRSYGTKLMDVCKELIQRHHLSDFIKISAHPQNMTLAFKEKSADLLVLKSLFQQEVISRGILFNGNHHATLSHGPLELERTIEIYDEAMSILNKAIESGAPERYLRTEPIKPIFSVRPQQ